MLARDLVVAVSWDSRCAGAKLLFRHALQGTSTHSQALLPLWLAAVPRLHQHSTHHHNQVAKKTANPDLAGPCSQHTLT
jgi:hypothetical protein